MVTVAAVKVPHRVNAYCYWFAKVLLGTWSWTTYDLIWIKITLNIWTMETVAKYTSMRWNPQWKMNFNCQINKKKTADLKASQLFFTKNIIMIIIKNDLDADKISLENVINCRYKSGERKHTMIFSWFHWNRMSQPKLLWR